jgi:GNAT superfamily N-acetyltransferase
MDASDLRIEEVNPANFTSELEDIVAVHLRGYTNHFLTLMGSAFIQEYYRAVSQYKPNIFLVARNEAGLIGFVSGFGNPVQFYSYYRSKRFKVMPTILVAILKRPYLIPRILSNFNRIRSPDGSSSEVELSSICVLPEHSGLLVGHALIQAFVNKARLTGFESVYLTTDARNNERGNAFYVKEGFHLERSLLQGRREVNLYRLILR